MRGVCSIALLAGTIAASNAQTAEHKPSPAEIAAVKICLAAKQSDQTYGNRVGKGILVCMDQNRETLAMFDCQIRETAVWDGLLNDYYQQRQNGISPKIFDRLRAVRRAWIAYRDAKCTFNNVWSWGDTWKLKQEHGYRLS